MALQTGNDVLLKIGDGGDPEAFTTLGGLRGTALSFNSQPIDVTHKASNHWRELLDSAGVRTVAIDGDGLFSDSASEDLLRQVAFANGIRNYRIEFGNGDVLAGAFKVTRYNRSGPHNGEEGYELTLASSGAITYTAA